MPKKGERRIGQCVYCGDRKELSKDHVPPKNLFGKPRPDNLITVDSCIDCNRSFEKIDEYFRAIIATLEESEKHPVAKELWETKIQLSFLKPSKIGFREMIRQSMKSVDIVSEGGILLGKRIAYEIDANRFFDVIRRTVKGLFWYERGFRLSDEFKVRVIKHSDFENISQRKLDFFEPLQPRVIGDGVFVYKALFFEEEPNGSAWQLLFYRSIPFICMTFPSKMNSY